jgi:hypothetical protein
LAIEVVKLLVKPLMRSCTKRALVYIFSQQHHYI